MKYQYLKQSDVIQPADEYRTNWGTWRQIETKFVGKRKGKVFGHYFKMRRKTPKTIVLKNG